MYIIDVSNLHKKFGSILAVDGVSFKVNEGEIFGFLGPNGAGKTTTINMLCTLLTPTSGSAKVAGYDVAKDPNEVRNSIGVIPQEIVLESHLTAKENLEFYADLYHIPKDEAEHAIMKLLKLVDLSERANTNVETFSGGMKRRLEIAKALLHNPKVIFMDEPTLGLDPQTRRHIWNYIKILNETQKITIFITTHYLEEADFLCNRVAIIDRGKIKAMDTPARLKEKLVKGSIIDVSVASGRDRLVERLKKAGYSLQTPNTNMVRMMVSEGKEVIADLFRMTKNMNIDITSIAMHEPSLEDVFIHYTGEAIREELGGSENKRVMGMLR